MILPDNEADYDDDHQPFDPDEADAPEALVWNLLLLINPGDEDSALRQFDLYRESLALGGDEAPVWRLKDIIDWTAGFFVGPDDTAALIESVDELAARFGIDIDWGGDRDDEEFLGATDVPELMSTAYDRLREHGYTLWSWNTDGEGYAGWMALRRDDDGMRALAHALEIDLRPGNEAA